MEQEQSFRALTELFRKFPGIGQRQAERFASFIARADPDYTQKLIQEMTELRRASKQCPECFIRHESMESLCTVCARDDADTLIIVEKDIDVRAMETSVDQDVKARYFILGGLIPIADENTPRVRLPQLSDAIRKKQPTEIVIALSVHPDADHTMRYLTDRIRDEFPDIKVTALGRGLSSGSELEYSDPETLINAFRHRG